MIILEGADNTGKSTLAQAIAKRFNIDIVHAGGPGYNPIRLQDEFAHLRRKCVMDRTNFISGPVYARVFNPPKGNWDAMRGFTEYLLANDLAIVIHCTGRGEPTHRDGEDPEYADAVVRNDESIRREYNEYFTSAVDDMSLYGYANQVEYNFNTDSIEPLLNYIAAFFKRQEKYREDFLQMAKTVSKPS